MKSHSIDSNHAMYTNGAKPKKAGKRKPGKAPNPDPFPSTATLDEKYAWMRRKYAVSVINLG